MSRVSVLWIMVPLLFFAGEISAQGTENALQFDGVDDYVAVVAPIGMPISAITIEAWIKLTAYSPWASIVDRYNSVNDGLDPFSFGLDNSTGSRLMFQWNNPGGSGWPNKIVSNSILPLGQWVHVAVISDEVTATFYVNGVPDGTGSVGALGVGNRIIIGANFPGGDEFFNGTIDEVRVWDFARTVQEIREDMHMTVVGERFGLVGCWRFGEGTGTTAADIVFNIPPNNGVLQNGPVWVESTVPLGNIDNPLDSRIAVPVSTPGLIAFGDLDMNFTAKSGTDTVVVTLLNTSPKGAQPGIVSITTFPTMTAKPVLLGERRVVLGEPRYAGETMTVPVMVDDRAGVLAGEMMLTYDPALVEIDEVKPVEEVMGWHVAGYAQEGRLLVVFAGAETGTGAGELFLIEVQSLRGMEDDGSPLTIAEVTLNDGMFTTRVQPRLPTVYALLQNIPNPFNPETQIRYELPKAGHVTVIVYSLTGQVVRTLMNRQQLAGRYMVTWDGRDEEGRMVASGIYIYRLTAGAFTAVRKMVMVR